MNTNSTAADSVMTIHNLLAATHLARALGKTRIVFTPTALAETTERLFPTSKNRSRRVHKKLVKRFGGEFRKEPAMWQVGDVIFAHPSFEARLKEQFQKRTNSDLESALLGGIAPFGR